jgi:hypothetical protein
MTTRHSAMDRDDSASSEQRPKRRSVRRFRYFMRRLSRVKDLPGIRRCGESARAE